MNSDHTPADQAASPAPPSGMGQLLERVDCSLIARLTVDPTATADGRDHRPREVRSGHFVPVAPTPIGAPQYVAHSPTVFAEMGLDEALVQDPAFRRLFSGDLSQAPAPLRTTGWATGYALSIYGTEYTQQCPFGTGNGYGDGRAISVMELVHEGRRWELQLKGSGPTPYCRGGDGRAVLRSSVREFLAQEFMHALGVRTSRSFTLYASTTDTVMRPWYSAGSRSMEPDVMQRHRVAIATRTASSFLRVGQLELFARRARSNAHPEALNELRAIVAHAIEREYAADIDTGRPFGEQVVTLARRFRARLTALVADWIRVGYCQGNFNSDNCAVGGFTLDYGPFGFCEPFDPFFQPWTGGGRHYSFFNQPTAAEANFRTLCSALRPLVHDDPARREELDAVEQGFAAEMDLQLRMMWARKLGLERFDADLFASLMSLMQKSRVDYTLFFRALCDLPRDAATLESTFHVPPTDDIRTQWQAWLDAWHTRLEDRTDYDPDAVSSAMKRISPRYAWREWLVAQAYENAEQGDYAGVRALQTLLTNPYTEQSSPLAAQSDQKRPAAFERLGGVSHYTCSS